jgi:hypothetical protein
MYSACAHTKGIAPPVGRPKPIWALGRSGKAQTCSGSNRLEVAKPSHCPDKTAHIACRRQLVMPALSRKHRPGVAVSPALVGAAIFALPIAVMVVPSPAGTEGRVHLEYCVHHAERILDQGIAGLRMP